MKLQPPPLSLSASLSFSPSLCLLPSLCLSLPLCVSLPIPLSLFVCVSPSVSLSCPLSLCLSLSFCVAFFLSLDNWLRKTLIGGRTSSPLYPYWISIVEGQVSTFWEDCTVVKQFIAIYFLTFLPLSLNHLDIPFCYSIISFIFIIFLVEIACNVSL